MILDPISKYEEQMSIVERKKQNTDLAVDSGFLSRLYLNKQRHMKHWLLLQATRF